jgi:CBS domain-containing protein
MTCSQLMTSDPACCVLEDSVVSAAILMKNHNIGSVPVVSDRSQMKVAGIVTDRDLTLRVVAEQRDYYRTRVADVMSQNLVTCRASDDYDEVIAAMKKRQIRRVPVVDDHGRLVGIISQADVARSLEPRQVAEVVEQISEPASEHKAAGGALATSTLMMIAGGLGLGAGLAYLVDPRWARAATQQAVEKVRSTFRSPADL